ncbi:unnamed protein product [Ectocarpus sp. 13 AM-2016]
MGAGRAGRRCLLQHCVGIHINHLFRHVSTLGARIYVTVLVQKAEFIALAAGHGCIDRHSGFRRDLSTRTLRYNKSFVYATTATTINNTTSLRRG